MARKVYKSIGILLILFSCSFFILEKNQERIWGEIEKNKIKDFFNQEAKIQSETYLGVLEIPELKIRNGFYSLKSKENNVDKNIELISGSTMPNQNNSNLILAAHSGTSKYAYFKNLFKLEIDDFAIIYYNNKKYIYRLVNNYKELKDGTITIHKESQIPILTLTTCDKYDENLQDIYIFYLINVESY